VNNKEAFKKWVTNNLTKDSGAGSAYCLSIDWLSERFFEKGRIEKKSIFEIEDLDLISELHSEVKMIQRDKSSFIYNKNAPSYGDRYFYSASLAKYKEYLEQKFNSNIISESVKFNLIPFKEIIFESGLQFNSQVLSRFTASLLTKPFIILTGLSGSGKTKLAQAFVQWICQRETQYRIIPVGADWTNREPLLGYPNALKPEEYVKPDSGALDLIIEANKHPDLPYFLILDEMNLSHVERYFADFLSVMESKEKIPLYAEGTVDNGVPAKLRVPSNLFIIGTVNIDETTNMFSPKVLDRANTIEFRVTEKEMKDFLGNIQDLNMEALNSKGADMAKSFLELADNKLFPEIDKDEINSTLLRFFGELKKTGAEFGYRSASEILRLINQLNVVDKELEPNTKMDIAIMQKLLPKLHGSRRKLCPVLETLGAFCIVGNVKIIKDVFEKEAFDFNSPDVLYPLSLEKISRMYKGAIDNGFTSFAEA
jgi:5-methylcytosine-specific restriction protein B